MQRLDTISLTPRRLAVELCCVLALAWLAAGQAGWLPLPPVLGDAGPAGALVQLVLVLPVAWLNRGVLARGVSALRALAPDSATLATAAAAVALVYGLYAGVAGPGGASLMMDSAAVLLLADVAAAFPRRVADRAAAPGAALRARLPETARLVRDGQPVTVPCAEMQAGDVFLVRAGESIPADAEVLEGEGTVDESALTGDGTPVAKSRGDTVCAATRSQSGALACKALRVGADTAAARAAASVAGEPGPLGQRAGQLAGVLAPLGLGLAVVVPVVWLLAGAEAPVAVARAVSVLAVCAPGAAGLAASAAALAALRSAAGQGLLFAGVRDLERIGATATVALAQEGAVTEGRPSVVRIIGTRKVPEKFLLGMAAGLESQNEDAMAQAVLERARRDGIKLSLVKNLEALPGRGMRGTIAGKVLAGGDAAFIETQCELTPDLREAGDRLTREGVTPLYFSLDGHAAGLIGVAQAMRPGTRQAVDRMRALGLQVVLLAGADDATATRLAGQLGLAGQVRGGESPLAGLTRPVAVAGTSAPMLAGADTGVSVGTAAAALPQAGLALPRGDLGGLPAAVELSRQLEQRVRRRLIAVAAYHLAALLLAAGVLAPLGLVPGPVLCAAAACVATACAARGGDAARTAPAPEEAP